MRHSRHNLILALRRFTIAISALSVLFVTSDVVHANDGGEPVYVALDVSSLRFPDKNSVDLLLTTSTSFFDDKTSKALYANDGYRLRLKFDDRRQVVKQQIDRTWSGAKGYYVHPKNDQYEANTCVHVREDGSMTRFMRIADEGFDSQVFDEVTRTWGKSVTVKVKPWSVSGSFNLTHEGGRWQCVEQGKPPTSVKVYDREQDKEVKDKWLETTILNHFQVADIWNETRISNEKNFVLFKQGHRDRTEFHLFGFGMPGSTKFNAPASVRARALREAGGGRAAIVFNSEPDLIYAHEIELRNAARIVDFKNVKRVQSKSLYNAMYDVHYHGENRTIVGVDEDSLPARIGSAAFEAKVRVVRWSLETGDISETVIPYGAMFQLVDRHVVPAER